MVGDVVHSAGKSYWMGERGQISANTTGTMISLHLQSEVVHRSTMYQQVFGCVSMKLGMRRRRASCPIA